MALIRTALFLALLTAFLLFLGFVFAGFVGMTIALFLAFILNFFAYFYSDKIVLTMYKAKVLNNKKINEIISELSKNAGIPKPKLYIIETDIPNAFATGRNPKHASIAVTRGLIKYLDEDEIEGVLSHEIAHIKNRDVLIACIAAVIAGAISYLAHIAWYSMFYDERRNAMLLPLIVLAPLAAMLIQFAISRAREFHADKTGAFISKKPLSLANALKRIEDMLTSHRINGNFATSHLWIVNPFNISTLSRLFSTHPPTQERIKRLVLMSKNNEFKI